MSQTMDGVSQEVWEDLYRGAVTQARRGMILNVLATATLLTAATAMWAGGWSAFGSLATSALGGVPATARGIARWRRLRLMSPTEAALDGEL